MDPVSHALFGRTVALTVRRRSELRGLTAALVLGSIAPDADALLAFGGFEKYLRAHVAGAHSLLGTLAGALVVAVFLRAIVRDARFPVLFAGAWAGTFGHMLWDLAGGGDINVLAPFSSHLSNWELVTMGDPWISAVLVAGALAAWMSRAQATRIAFATLALLVVVLAGKGMSQAVARRAYQAAVETSAPRPTAMAITPRFARLFDWTVYDRVDGRVRAWAVNSRTGAVSPLFERRDAVDREVTLSRDLPVVQAFMSFARMPFARLETSGADHVVLWSDVRMCSAARCDLSFGGAFSAAAAPLYQIVQIGGFREVRPVP